MSKLLEVEHLSVSFQTPRGVVQAVRDISFSLEPGEVLAVAGESGCGKSVMCKSIVKLLPPAAQIKAEKICIHGMDIKDDQEREMCRLRGKVIGMVLQDPMASLNPTITIGAQIAEAIRVHQPGISKKQLAEKVEQLLQLVGIDRPMERAGQYPHQCSGGMLQRIVLAAALAPGPQILLADEPTTALDVTTQAKILDLLADLPKRLGMAVVFVTHDLGAAARLADRVAVMYAGKIVEIGTAAEVYQDPGHPYTWGLLRSHPAFSAGKELLPVIPGMPPVLLHPPKGDAFACRNVYALGIDYEKQPPMFRISETHQAASWLLDERAPRTQDGRPVSRHTGFAPQTQDGGPASWHTGFVPQTQDGGPASWHTGFAPQTQDGGPASWRTTYVSDESMDAPDIPSHRKAARTKPGEILLDVQHLCYRFPLTGKEEVRAADDVSFRMEKGEIFGLVGESGCGKSTIARCVMNLYHPQSGRILYQGMDSSDPKAFRMHKRQLQKTRQIIFQDSNSSLNPRMKVCDIITEPMKIHKIRPKRGSYRAEAAFQMKYVGLDEVYLDQYPSVLSGGQRQRVAIARALSMEPELLVADEPLASLDVSMQAQIVNLFKHLQKEHGFSFLFIAHDLAVVEFLCDRVGVLYRGRLVECAPVAELFSAPLHPYTKSLLAAVPVLDPEKERAKRRMEVREQEFSSDGEWRQAAPGHYVRMES